MDNATYLRNLRNQSRDVAFETLGRKCVKCGATEHLEFDHIDPTTKKFAISTMLAGKLWPLLEELKKCQVLCRKCHREKTRKENSKRQFGTGKHGTMWMYWKHKCRCGICKEYKHQHYLKNKKPLKADLVKAAV